MEPWLRRAAFPRQRWLAARAVPPRLPSCIFHSQIRGGACQETLGEDSGMLWFRKARGGQPVPRPPSPSPSRVGPDPAKVLAKRQGPLSPSQGGSETIPLCGFLSPHQSHSCCTSAWALDGCHSAMLLPPKYLLALLYRFAVVFPSAPNNYTRTIYEYRKPLQL